MRNKPMPRSARILISAGMLVPLCSYFINDYHHLPDVVRGAALGFGVGLMIVGLVRAQRQKKSACMADEPKEV